MAANIWSDVGGFAMSSKTVIAVGQFSSAPKYSLYLDTIAGFALSTCEYSASLIDAITKFGGTQWSTISKYDNYLKYTEAPCSLNHVMITYYLVGMSICLGKDCSMCQPPLICCWTDTCQWWECCQKHVFVLAVVRLLFKTAQLF